MFFKVFKTYKLIEKTQISNAPGSNTDDVAILKKNKAQKNKLNSSLIEWLFTEECEMPALYGEV